MIKINDRLKKISSFVDHKSSGVIDVGCDHALLDIYLKEKYKDLRIVASDIGDGPLLCARSNLKKYGMVKKIELVKMNGIEKIDEYIDTIVISGMGTESIINILIKDINKLNRIKKLIISSNNKYFLLRRELSNIGFIINRESIVYEDDKYYIIEEFVKGEKNYTYKELYFGPYLLRNKNDLFYKYYGLKKIKLIALLDELPKEKINKINIINEEIKLLGSEI